MYMRSKKITSMGLEQLRMDSPEIHLNDHPKIAIFSDLHMGNGSTRDDFRKNSAIFRTVLEQHYYPNGYTLVLNGDVEELQKYRYRRIHKAWGDIFDLFHAFHDQGRLFKLVGNHDWATQAMPMIFPEFPVHQALRITWNDHEFFVFHGHQARRMYDLLRPFITLGLRFLAVPLGLMNYSISHDSARKFRMERRVYQYSREKKIASIIGHTHRPLFESLSKRDMMIYRLESLIRKLHDATADEKKQIEQRIRKYRKRIEQITEIGETSSLLYSELVPVPCLFNSGYCIGKRGIINLEIADEKISLIQWFDEKVDKSFVRPTGHAPNAIPGTSTQRMVIKKDTLSYIFSCIDLLS